MAGKEGRGIDGECVESEGGHILGWDGEFVKRFARGGGMLR